MVEHHDRNITRVPNKAVVYIQNIFKRHNKFLCGGGFFVPPLQL